MDNKDIETIQLLINEKNDGYLFREDVTADNIGKYKVILDLGDWQLLKLDVECYIKKSPVNNLFHNAVVKYNTKLEGVTIRDIVGYWDNGKVVFLNTEI